MKRADCQDCKAILSIMRKFISKNTKHKKKAKTKIVSNVINLSKFEISRFGGDSIQQQSFYGSF